MLLKIKRRHDNAKMPTYGTEDAACFDIYSMDASCVYPGTSESFRTGLIFEVPKGHAMLVYSRSGMGFKSGVRLSNCVGVIDSDYRGELMVSLQNDGTEFYQIMRGDRIAQAMIVPVPYVKLVEAHQLSETARGTGGLGSTGK